MTDNTPLTDRILDLIDNELQSSHEPACDASSPDLCARCQCHESAEGGDLCAGCRAWMLEDSDEDPKDPERFWWERRAERAAGLAQTSRADLQRHIETRRREDITRLHAEIRQMAAYYPARQSFPDILPDP